jgi:hypothetical protein
MPAGRNQVDYTDIRYDAITMKADGVTITFDATQPRGAAATMLDKAVSLSANDTVQLCADGDPVFGKLLKVESTPAGVFCTVQRWGMVTLPAGAAAVVTLGRSIVGALGAASARGYIRQTISAGAAYVQAEAVEQARGRGQIVNNADTTAVVVDLG